MNFEELPLSYAQQRLWFLDQLEPNSSFYNVPLALHLAGDLQADILEKSLQEIIQRHESLRTNFATIEGNPVQVIKPESNWQLTLVNGKDSPKYREDQEIAAMCKTIIQNIIILWNYIALTKIIMRSDSASRQTLLENITNASILSWRHVNLHGIYDFSNLLAANDQDYSFNEVVSFKAA
jgi:hypothetical protein